MNMSHLKCDFEVIYYNIIIIIPTSERTIIAVEAYTGAVHCF